MQAVVPGWGWAVGAGEAGPILAGKALETCQRGWDAGVTVVVLGYPLCFMDCSKHP